MASIPYRIEIQAPTGAVYEVVSTLGGLRSWWTTDLYGNPEKGGELKVGFGDDRASGMKVKDAKKNKSLALHVTSTTFPEGKDWVGTIITFAISESPSRGTIVVFEHAGWKENAVSFNMSKARWGRAMESLKELCETGKGKPEVKKQKPTKKATGWFPVS
jgi:hypothetical protein